MSITAGSRQARYAMFVALMLSINIIDGLLMRFIANPGQRLMVAGAATIDVVLVVSVAYYWLLVRPGIQGRTSVMLIALLGILRATCFYPSAGSGKALVAGLCEAGMIGFVFTHIRRSRRRGVGYVNELDPLDAIRAALGSIVALPVVANLIAVEIGILYYALFSWRGKPYVPSGARAFSIHKKSGHADLLAVLAVASVVELVPVHLILRSWNSTLALAITILGLYSLVWLVGMARAFRLRPVLVTSDYIDVRYGLFFRLHVPRDALRHIRRAKAVDKQFAVPRKSEPNLCIELARSMHAEGLFGVRRSICQIAVTADDPQAFEQAAAELLRIN